MSKIKRPYKQRFTESEHTKRHRQSAIKQRQIKKAFKQRYSENWKEVSRFTRALTCNRCCYPGCTAKATCTHHVNYKTPYKPLENIFPLCDRHHGTDPKTGHKLPVAKMDKNAAHHPKNWQPGTFAHNYQDACSTAEYVARLRFGVALIVG